MSISIEEGIAEAAFKVFNGLPKHHKPLTSRGNKREWTPLAAVVLTGVTKNGIEQQPVCMSLGTGTKCLSASQIPKCAGSVLHDCHAEIIALRGFNRGLLEETKEILTKPSHRSDWLDFKPCDRTCQDRGFAHDESGHGAFFELKPNISISLFTTEAPCGDASMELLMESKDPQDAVPWASVTSEELQTSPSLLGRGFFSKLGVVRRKPARADAEASLSKSCSDKIALKQFTGLLAFPVNLIILQTPSSFLTKLVTYYDQYNELGYERAFGKLGRLSVIDEPAARFFEARTLPKDYPRFEFSKSMARASELQLAASNISAVWIQTPGASNAHISEVLFNGVKRGFQPFEDTVKKESVLCRRSMWRSYLELQSLILAASADAGKAIENGIRQDSEKTYGEAKISASLQNRGEQKRRATEAMQNWIRNTGDEDWRMYTP